MTRAPRAFSEPRIPDRHRRRAPFSSGSARASARISPPSGRRAEARTMNAVGGLAGPEFVDESHGPGSPGTIFISPAAKAPLIAIPEVRAVVGRGLEGDRYFHGVGSFSRWSGEGRAVTLIEAEAIEAVLAKPASTCPPAAAAQSRHPRRPAARPERPPLSHRPGPLPRHAPVRTLRLPRRLTEPGVFAALEGRGGLRRCAGGRAHSRR